MGKISATQIGQVYRLAKRMHSEEIDEDGAVSILNESYGMNRISGRAYTWAVGHMLSGDRYTMTINREAVQYHLDAILKDFGTDGGLRALNSLNGHISSYQKHSKSLSLVGIAERFSAKLASLSDDFDHQVSQSIRLSKSARMLLLPKRGTKPSKVSVTIQLFKRNPHVVAEVLTRAQGRCQNCKFPAPFTRSSDGTPYLEVHHRKTLASGGDDTVDNAVALCPNCHRKQHYG